MNINIGEYTREENSVYVGKIAKYRRRISEGLTPEEASIECGKDIIADGECGSGGVLKKRYYKTKDPIDSFAQHIRHMDEVVAGVIDESNLRRSDVAWKGLIPYPNTQLTFSLDN